MVALALLLPGIVPGRLDHTEFTRTMDVRRMTVADDNFRGPTVSTAQPPEALRDGTMDDPSAESLAEAQLPGLSRRQILARTRLDFWLDATILVGYIFAYCFGFTGDVIHEWLGLALGLALAVHLTLHWDWVLRTTRKLIRPRGQDRLIYAVNLALLVAMTLCIASGIMISRAALPTLGIFLSSSLFWNRLHILTAEITLYLVPVHVALRWRWIVAVGRRLLTRAGRRGSR
jgi:hypothetical protein